MDEAVSYLDDPRVFFAAERTLLAWQRTSIAMIGLGFVIQRFNLFLRLVAGAKLPPTPGRPSLVCAVVLLLAGAAVATLSSWQYRRFVRTLGAPEIPRGHVTWLGPALNIVLTFVALAMAVWFALTQ